MTASHDFTFGIITDTHIRAPKGDLSSPFPVNDRANDRARYAARLLAAQQPEFNIHLGDMVHPLPHMPVYAEACAEALDILSPLDKLHFVPGNHDIGDKPMPASPAVPATDDSVARYQEFFNQSYHSFCHKGCLIVAINSSVLNTGCATEKQQQQWLQSTLQNTECKRIILFSHYPLYVHQPDEPEHYDNIAQPARNWLLGLIKKHAIAAVFSGHVHHYFYNRHDDTDMYVLPATSFTRQDYSELYRIEPCSEFGRDDTGKYSVTVVSVSANGITPNLIPTDGKQESIDNPQPVSQSPAAPIQPFVVHLRHAWYESIDLPYNGPMEEFSRKRARNDYTLLRLLQTGIVNVRVPLNDLTDTAISPRCLDYQHAGINFHPFCLLSQLSTFERSDSQPLASFATLEIVCPPESLHNTLCFDRPGWLNNKRLLLSKAHSSSHAPSAGRPFAHSVSSGFLPEEIAATLGSLQQLDQTLHAVVCQVPLEYDAAQTIAQIYQHFASSELECVVNVRLSNSNPAVDHFNDEAIAERVQAAIAACAPLDGLTLQFDTFADIDRGYGPRHGFVDRHVNFRRAGRALLQNHYGTINCDTDNPW